MSDKPENMDKPTASVALERGPTPNHLPGGNFAPGNKASTGGKLKLHKQFQDALKEKYYEKALDVVWEGLMSDSDKLKMWAADTVFDRLFGRPSIAVTGEDGEPLAVALMPLFQRLMGDESK